MAQMTYGEIIEDLEELSRRIESGAAEAMRGEGQDGGGNRNNSTRRIVTRLIGEMRQRAATGEEAS
jgi:hypothetical protein